MKTMIHTRLFSMMMITVMVMGTVFTANVTRAKGDAVFTLSAGSALGTVSDADSMKFVEMDLSVGASDVFDGSVFKNETEAKSYSEQLEEEEQAERDARYTMVMAKTTDYVNVRRDPAVGSEAVGVLYDDCGGEILKHGENWTMIQSGALMGWVSNDYLYFEEEAEEYAEEVCTTYANVDTQALRVRTEPDEDAEIIGLLEVGTNLETIKTEEEEVADDDWIKVRYEGKEGYVASDYVTLSLFINEGETMQEIEERERMAAMEKTKLVTNNGSVSANVDDTTLLAAIIQCEAGNQCYEGKLAVGAVVLNRVRSGSFPNNIHDVIYAPSQFGPVSNGSLSRALANGVSDSCRQAAEEALSGSTNVGNALYFRRAGGRDGLVIGDHVFY